MDTKILTDDLIGKPFVDGGRGPKEFDCWGLAIEIFKRIGYNIPNFTVGAFKPEEIDKCIKEQRVYWKAIKEPQVGCLILMRLGRHQFVNHCGIYLGNGLFIHTREKLGCCIDRINSPIFKPLLRGLLQPPEEYSI